LFDVEGTYGSAIDNPSVGSVLMDSFEERGRVAVAKAISYTGSEVLSNDESTIGEEPATEGGKGLWQRI